MNINLKKCQKCKDPFDIGTNFNLCPKCRELEQTNKKMWLDHLYYNVGKQQYDFKLCGLKKNPDESITSTKWKKYSEVCFPLEPWEDYKLKWINNRQILPNELVLDIEEKEGFDEIIKKVKTWGYPYRVFSTGSRGFHIHMFFDKELTKEEKLRIIETLKADKQKAHENSMIALEYCPHWKTGKMKEEITWK